MARFTIKTPSNDVALFAKSVGGGGIEAVSDKDTGVLGVHGDPNAFMPGLSILNSSFGRKAGIYGASEDGPGVLGFADASDMPAVYAYGGLRAVAVGKEFSAEFHGNVRVVGDIRLDGADCAEQFDVVGGSAIEPGSVVVIDADGALRQSSEPYDTKVAGVISGAGTYGPAVILDQQPSSSERLCVSLIGKVFCKVDGEYGSIAVGDLLTTAPTPGHAMTASDPQRAFGAVLGKALKPWNGGRGLIPILVALG